ncbi:GNAT family N-acetyltransferase [Cellulomonas sp. URHB0016]
MAGAVVRVARGRQVADAGALTAEAYLADRLVDATDAYADELRDAERRSREGCLLVALLPPGEGDASNARVPDAGADHDDLVVVGTVTLAPYGTSYAEVAEPGELEIRMLAVAPEARRQGIAELLVAAALREAVAHGARRVVLSTLDSMEAARRLYGRLGFVAAPERDWGHVVVHLRVHTWTPPDAPGALVEAATWPPARVVEVDGWRVGLSGGMTRRANSVLPLGVPADVDAAIDRVEEIYADAGQPSVFRVCRAATPGLDDRLERRGYVAVSRADVLVRGIERLGRRPADPHTADPHTAHPHTADAHRADVHMADLHAADLRAADLHTADVHTDAGPVRVSSAARPDDSWLGLWAGSKARLHATGAASDDGTALAMARVVLGGAPAVYLLATDPDGPVGVVRAAFAEDWVALSCLVVAPRARRRGLGRHLTVLALDEGARRGARRAFLQVEAESTGAATLYAGLGFQPSERYLYRER